MPEVAYRPVPTETIVGQIIQFCEAYSEVKFYPYQVQFATRVIESILENDGEEITALFARQSGKTETIAVVAGAICAIFPFLHQVPQYAPDKRFLRFKRGVWIGIFAPILEQSQTTFDRLRSRLTTDTAYAIFQIPELSINFETNNGNCIELNNGSKVMCMSASDQSHTDSKTFHVIIIEECQEVSNSKVRRSIHPMGAATNATIIKIGTAFTYKGDFYDSIGRNKRRFNETGKKNHFEYDYETVQKYNPLYAKYIEKEISRLGYDSDEFRMSYRLHWILERGMAVTPEQLEKMGFDYGFDANGKPAVYDIIESRRNSRQCAGLDLAKASDSTVLTISETDYSNITADGFYYQRILNWLELLGDDYESQFYQIRDFLGNYNVEKMCVDSTGVGDPITDRLISALPAINIIPYRFTRPSKSDLYKYFLNACVGARIRYPNSPNAQKTRRQRKFVQQMLDLEKTYEGEYLCCEHPDEKEAHDDFPVSAALSVWASKEEEIPIMSMGDNVLYATAH